MLVSNKKYINIKTVKKIGGYPTVGGKQSILD